MISRSVPGYTDIIQGIGLLADSFVRKNSRVYDLGCSLGAASLSIREQVQTSHYEIIAIDNSAAMVQRCQQHLGAFRTPVNTTICQADILDFDYQSASFIVINFTLQFLDKASRSALLRRLYKVLLPGGALILSEKLTFADDKINQLLTQQHHLFKKQNGYSDLEISQKRAALENVLIPETLQQHYHRLKQAGFSHTYSWFQRLNFISLISIK